MLVCVKCLHVGRDVELLGIDEVALCDSCAMELYSILKEHVARKDAEQKTCND